MTTEVAVTEGRQLARPLSVLVPLIRDDLQEAKSAGMPYYRAAGEKMIEAKNVLKVGEFMPWVSRNFQISHRQANEYMNLARATSNIQGTTGDGQNGSAIPFSTMRETVHKTRNNPNYGKTAAWREEIKKAVKEARRLLEQQHQERAQEQTLQRKLALQVFDICYKFLAAKLHPDKGGSTDAMTRLNQVRNRLRQSV